MAHEDERAEQPTRKVENQAEGGRYGTAPDGKPHLSPEIEPARGADPDLRVPDAIPGALPENAARRPDQRTFDEPQNEVSGKNPEKPRLEGEKHWERRDPPEDSFH